MSITPSFSADGQKPNGFIGKSDISSPSPPPLPSRSHDGHMTYSNTGSSDGAEFDLGALIEDPFYNFDEMGQDSSAIQSILDPHNPNGIPFIDNGFADSISPVEHSEFDPDLFDSILSTENDILARLESTSSNASGGMASFELPLDEGGQRLEEGGAREEPACSPESPLVGEQGHSTGDHFL